MNAESTQLESNGQISTDTSLELPSQQPRRPLMVTKLLKPQPEKPRILERSTTLWILLWKIGWRSKCWRMWLRSEKEKQRMVKSKKRWKSGRRRKMLWSKKGWVFAGRNRNFWMVDVLDKKERICFVDEALSLFWPHLFPHNLSLRFSRPLWMLRKRRLPKLVRIGREPRSISVSQKREGDFESSILLSPYTLWSSRVLFR